MENEIRVCVESNGLIFSRNWIKKIENRWEECWNWIRKLEIKCGNRPFIFVCIFTEHPLYLFSRVTRNPISHQLWECLWFRIKD
jgi:hypothetical protein